jgi:hypothetical protein
MNDCPHKWKKIEHVTFINHYVSWHECEICLVEKEITTYCGTFGEVTSDKSEIKYHYPIKKPRTEEEL